MGDLFWRTILFQLAERYRISYNIQYSAKSVLPLDEGSGYETADELVSVQDICFTYFGPIVFDIYILNSREYKK